jgi:hypothetical protein
VAALQDPVRLALFKQAVSEWRYSGAIVFKPAAWEWLRRTVGHNRTQKGVSRLLWEHVQRGGEIDEQVENRKLEVNDLLSKRVSL